MRWCNEAEGFHLPSTGPLTAHGRPTAAAWDITRARVMGWPRTNIMTGQIVAQEIQGNSRREPESLSWASQYGPDIDFGFIRANCHLAGGQVTDVGCPSSQPEWALLTDGNDAPGRAFFLEETENNMGSGNANGYNDCCQLAVLCLDASNNNGAQLDPSGHIWINAA